MELFSPPESSFFEALLLFFFIALSTCLFLSIFFFLLFLLPGIPTFVLRMLHRKSIARKQGQRELVTSPMMFSPRYTLLMMMMSFFLGIFSPYNRHLPCHIPCG